MVFDLSVEVLDQWCDKLMSCNSLTENEIMRLCTKVSKSIYSSTSFVSSNDMMQNTFDTLFLFRPKKYWAKNPMYSW